MGIQKDSMGSGGNIMAKLKRRKDNLVKPVYTKFFKNREYIAKRVAKFCCCLVGVLCLVFNFLDLPLYADAIIWLYYLIFWMAPAISFFYGLDHRKKWMLCSWCISLIFNVFVLDFCCAMVIYNHATELHLNYDSTFNLAIVILCFTPIWLLPFFLSLIVVMNMNKNIDQQPARVPVVIPLVQRDSEATCTGENGTTNRQQTRGHEESTNPQITRPSFNPTSLIGAAQAGGSSVLQSIFGESEFESMSRRGSRSQTARESAAPVSHEDRLPSYSEVDNMGLPSYEELGTARVQIGSSVIVMDKSLNISAFTDPTVV